MKKNMNNSAALTEDERKKMRKAAYIGVYKYWFFVHHHKVYGFVFYPDDGQYF